MSYENSRTIIFAEACCWYQRSKKQDCQKGRHPYYQAGSGAQDWWSDIEAFHKKKEIKRFNYEQRILQEEDY